MDKLLTKYVTRVELRNKLNREMQRYKNFDPAHNISHVKAVLEETIEIIKDIDIDNEIAITVAVYHDLGLSEGREFHEISSGKIVRSDKELADLFNDDKIEIIAQAVEDHRASSKREPRNVYGKIVSDADRVYDFDTIITRCIQHREGSKHMDDAAKSFGETRKHIKEKYAEGGYLPEFHFRKRDKMTFYKLNEFANNKVFAWGEFMKFWMNLKK